MLPFPPPHLPFNNEHEKSPYSHFLGLQPEQEPAAPAPQPHAQGPGQADLQVHLHRGARRQLKRRGKAPETQDKRLLWGISNSENTRYRAEVSEENKASEELIEKRSRRLQWGISNSETKQWLLEEVGIRMSKRIRFQRSFLIEF